MRSRRAARRAWCGGLTVLELSKVSMHKSRLGTVVIDCQTDHLDQAAQFWSLALGPANANEWRSRPSE
jgi:hypothetical protein